MIAPSGRNVPRHQIWDEGWREASIFESKGKLNWKSRIGQAGQKDTCFFN